MVREEKGGKQENGCCYRGKKDGNLVLLEKR